jgi:ribosomal protein S18 acetylase RimI-like enzyme
VLTDRVQKALVLDLIVHPARRSEGLGSFLMSQVLAHPIISQVRGPKLRLVRE